MKESIFQWTLIILLGTAILLMIFTGLHKDPCERCKFENKYTKEIITCNQLAKNFWEKVPIKYPELIIVKNKTVAIGYKEGEQRLSGPPRFQGQVQPIQEISKDNKSL